MPPLDLDLRLANVFQSPLAQSVRIALASFRKFNDFVWYRLLNVVVAVSDPQADADLITNSRGRSMFR
jgi:ABC-type phosphate/phosphonate transport system permease subunit